MSCNTQTQNGLRSLTSIYPVYMLPTDPFVENLLVPCFKSADRVDCMVGFFSSEVLSSLAPGLAAYIASSENSFRLIISPLLQEEDIAAIEQGTRSVEGVANDLLEDWFVTEDLIQKHTLKCLSWFLRTGRLEIKVALMKDALFHPKVWLFHSDRDTLAAHGSSNSTYAGIKKNIEQVIVSCSWQDLNQELITDKLEAEFSKLWEDNHENCLVITIPEAVKQKLLKSYSSDSPPTEEQLEEIYMRATQVSGPSGPFNSTGMPVREFKIPESLQYESGPFAHQGKAVQAWCDAGYRGVLEMATGSGKTVTSMIAAHRLYKHCTSLLVVVAAPYVPLIEQWCDEVEEFGIRPIDMTKLNLKGRKRKLSQLSRSLRNGSSNIEIIVVSHKTLCTPEFVGSLQDFSCDKLLIADEAHNLGSESFISNPPEFFEYRLALSATPVRQYDEEGTRALFEYFGRVVFEFSLKEAIGTCLVEYDYYVHRITLTQSELDLWRELTGEIRDNMWREADGTPDDYVTYLRLQRRQVLETAEEKVDKLRYLLEKEGVNEISHTLIYTTDKQPSQLETVNRMLANINIPFRQLTADETSSRGKAKAIIESFQRGEIRVLTAKRVLDEGVNIPQICRAYILASTTVERQWTQRRGRLLRRCKEIGKESAEIHDFLTLPGREVEIDSDIRDMASSELTRILEFAKLSRNYGRPDGAVGVMKELRELFLS